MNNNNLNQQSPPICQDCNSDDQLILHNIILTPKSQPKKLCNSCVLVQYHKSCCAQCFELYDTVSLTPPPLTNAAAATGNNRLLRCMRCDNWSHFGCPGKNVPKSPYICPPCMSPNYKYFEFRKSRNGKIDKDASKQLLGAAKIASITVAKAVAVARVEADRRAGEAALSRKRAREAIDHFVGVAGEVEGFKLKEMSSAAVGPNAVRLESNGGGNLGDLKVKNGRNAGNGNGNGPVPIYVVMPHQQTDNGGAAVQMDSSNAAVQFQSK